MFVGCFYPETKFAIKLGKFFNPVEKQNQFYLAIIKLPYFYKIKSSVKINSYYSHTVIANTSLIYNWMC